MSMSSNTARIEGVDERLGCETQRYKDGDCWQITLTICRHYDLVIPTDFQVRCQLPIALLSGSNKTSNASFRSNNNNTSSSSSSSSSNSDGKVSLGKVFLINREHARYFPLEYLKKSDPKDSNNNNDIELIIPWFQNQSIDNNVILAISKHCTLAMWFFSIRLLVRKNMHNTMQSSSSTSTEGSGFYYEPWRASVLLSPYICYHHPPAVVTTNNDALIIGGVGRNKGRRGYMEDVDFQFDCIKVQDKREVSIYGVLDGHGGTECAQFIADDIPMKITTLLRTTASSSSSSSSSTSASSMLNGIGGSFRGGIGGGGNGGGGVSNKKSRGHSTADMIYRAFQDIDEEFIQSNTASHVYQPSNAGSTANILLYDREENRFYIANTGDTRAILHREGNQTKKYFEHLQQQPGSNNSNGNTRVIDLSYDRKATDAEEIVRIMKEGGFVLNGRVLGSLAVSRAFGDVLLKVPSKLTAPTDSSSDKNSPSKRYRYVIADPEITSFTPCMDDRFIVVATDGLWDVMSSIAVDNYVTQALIREEVLLPVNKADLDADPVDYSKVDTMVNGLLSKDEIKTKLNKIGLNIATHAIENLRSADNVTVMILLIQSNHFSAEDDNLDLDQYVTSIQEFELNNRHRDHTNFLTNSSNIETPTVFTRPNTMQSIKGAGRDDDDFLNDLELLTNGSSGIVKSQFSKPTSYAPPQQQTSFSSNNKIGSAKVNPKKKDDDDDDLMSFLQDDSNF